MCACESQAGAQPAGRNGKEQQGSVFSSAQRARKFFRPWQVVRLPARISLDMAEEAKSVRLAGRVINTLESRHRLAGLQAGSSNQVRRLHLEAEHLSKLPCGRNVPVVAIDPFV